MVADQHHLMAAQPGQAALDGRIVAELPVAVYLPELPANHLHIVFKQWPLRMAGNLDSLPGRKVVVRFSQEGGVIAAKLAKFFRIIHLFLGLNMLQVPDLLFQLCQWLLKVQHVARLGLSIFTAGGFAWETLERGDCLWHRRFRPASMRWGRLKHTHSGP